MCKPRYKFVYRGKTPSGKDTYVWEAAMPNSSLVDQVRCTVDYFWSKEPNASPAQ